MPSRPLLSVPHVLVVLVLALVGATWPQAAGSAVAAPEATVADVFVPVGQPFSRQLVVAAEDPGNVAWQDVSGLPDGVTLSSSGRLAGELAAQGSWTVSYAVRGITPPTDPAQGTFLLTAAEFQPNLSAGGQTTCEVRADATAWCWGANAYGQLGDGTSNDRVRPRRVSGEAGWSSISTSGATTCGVRLDATLWCWGMNHRGQLGIGDRPRQSVPVQVPGATAWTQVATGWLNTCAIDIDGFLWCWGDNTRGQVGAGPGPDVRKRPVRVGTSKWTSVTVGGFYACATKANGKASCWGGNAFGQLGRGVGPNRSVPAAVAGNLSWQRLDAGWTSTCGVTTSGAALCWGLNDQGQLGSTGGNHPEPTPVAGRGPWSTVTVGDSFACGLTTAGAAVCWGNNRYGQLGDGQASLRSSARKVSGAQEWAEIDAGWYSVCGRPVQGARACWGNNERGQLGRGDRTNRDTPTGARSAAPFPSKAGRDPRTFVAATFNVLGSQHTEPGGGTIGWAPGRLRSEWAANLIQTTRTGLLGFQEIQPDQITTLDRIIGDRFDFWPGNLNGPRAAWQTVAWDTRTWELVAAQNVDLPVLGRTRPHPLVLLRNKRTGQQVWLFNIHNSSKNTPERKAERRRALKQIVKVVRKKRKAGTAFVLLGDFNDRTEAFCTVVGKTDLKAVIGGRVKGGRCKPPKHMGIDWIFASEEVDRISSKRVRDPMVVRITDHPVLYAKLRLP